LSSPICFAPGVISLAALKALSPAFAACLAINLEDNAASPLRAPPGSKFSSGVTFSKGLSISLNRLTSSLVVGAGLASTLGLGLGFFTDVGGSETNLASL
jgi:hypothetical protein